MEPDICCESSHRYIEMHTENANYFLKHLDESFETYLEKTRHAFSGANADIYFFLEDYTFTWKQQNILIRGEIAVQPLSNLLVISDTLMQLSELYEKCQEQIQTLEKENDGLKKTNTKLITDIEEMIDIKNIMEKDLYTKFLLLLNTKKKRIRELQKVLNSKEQTTRSVYEETTDDESQGSDIESKKIYNTNAKSFNTRKRTADYENEHKTILKSDERNFKRRINSSEGASPEPSTSKIKSENIDTHDVMKSKHTLDISDEESEEDMFS
nr:PREDICTED: DNA repair protein XRCC4-like isoform X2 [Linepithema humile]